jgi:predicted CopG family antitoxin
MTKTIHVYEEDFKTLNEIKYEKGKNRIADVVKELIKNNGD